MQKYPFNWDFFLYPIFCIGRGVVGRKGAINNYIYRYLLSLLFALIHSHKVFKLLQFVILNYYILLIILFVLFYIFLYFMTGATNVLTTTPLWVVNTRLKIQGVRTTSSKKSDDEEEHRSVPYKGIAGTS